MGLGCEGAGGGGARLPCVALRVMSAGADMGMMSSMKDINLPTAERLYH